MSDARLAVETEAICDREQRGVIPKAETLRPRDLSTGRRRRDMACIRTSAARSVSLQSRGLVSSMCLPQSSLPFRQRVPTKSPRLNPRSLRVQGIPEKTGCLLRRAIHLFSPARNNSFPNYVLHTRSYLYENSPCQRASAFCNGGKRGTPALRLRVHNIAQAQPRD